MNGFLYNIVNNNGVQRELDYYNSNFFSQYIDVDKISGLLKTNRKYIELMKLLKERYKDDFLFFINDNNLSIQKIEQAINELTSNLKNLEKDREKYSQEISSIYDSNIFDYNKIQLLENAINYISDRKRDMHFKLNKYYKTYNSLKGQERKNNEDISKLDNNIEVILNQIIGYFKNNNLDDLNSLDIFNSKEIMYKYEKGLKKIMPNDLLRKTYMNYFTKLVNEEIKSIKSNVNDAYFYSKNANKSNEFLVPYLFGKNKQIISLDNLIDFSSQQISNYFSIMNNEENESLVKDFVDGYDNAEEYMDQLFDFAGNYSKYYNNLELESEMFKKLKDGYTKMHSKIEKLKSNTLDKIVKKIFGLESYFPIKTFGYRDLAIPSFESFIDNNIYGNAKKKDRQKEEKKISKFKNNKKSTKQENKTKSDDLVIEKEVQMKR